MTKLLVATSGSRAEFALLGSDGYNEPSARAFAKAGPKGVNDLRRAGARSGSARVEASP